MGIALRGALRFEPDIGHEPQETGYRKLVQEKDPTGGGGDPNYYNKLITLFPAEGLTLYGTGVAIFGHSTLVTLVVCLAVLGLLRFVATLPKDPKDGLKPDWWAIGVAGASFLLWTTAHDSSWLADISARLDQELIGKWAAFVGAAVALVGPAVIPSPSPPGSKDADKADH